MRHSGRKRPQPVRGEELIAQELSRSNTVGFTPHWCQQNADAVWTLPPQGLLVVVRLAVFSCPSAFSTRVRMEERK